MRTAPAMQAELCTNCFGRYRNRMRLQAPWRTPPNAPALRQQLAREMPPRHVLVDTPVKAIAQRDDCDDVLFELLDGSGRVAVVHLTYSRNADALWPQTELFSSYSEWHSERMRSNSRTFHA